MTIRVALNGIHRLNRLALQAISEGGFSDLFEVVAIVGPGTPTAVAQLLSLDVRYGAAAGTVEVDDQGIRFNGSTIALVPSDKAGKLPWKEMEVDLVIEAGSFSTADTRKRQRSSGAKKVVLTSGTGDVDAVIVGGVNEATYDPDSHHSVSTGPAWLNCCAPVLRVVQDGFGIRRGAVTSISALGEADCQDDRIDADGRVVRSSFHDLAVDVAPDGGLLTSLLPVLNDKIGIQAFKSPAGAASIVTLAAELERPAETEALREMFAVASASDELAGILGVSDREPVSAQILRDPRSAVVDLGSVRSINGQQLSVAVWYDQEWALACRVAELTSLVCEAGIPGTA